MIPPVIPRDFTSREDEEAKLVAAHERFVLSGIEYKNAVAQRIKDLQDAAQPSIDEIKVTKWKNGRPTKVDWNGETWIYKPEGQGFSGKTNTNEKDDKND